MEISLSRLLSTLWKHIIPIIACGVIGLAVSLITTLIFNKPTYEASVKMLVEVDNENSTSQELLADSTYVLRIINSYIEILKVDSFYNEVAERTGLNYSSTQLNSMINYRFEEGTQSFSIIVRANNAKDAKLIADIMSELSPDRIKSFRNEASIKSLGEANLPDRPVDSKTKNNSMLGLILGLFISGLYFCIREALDTRIKSENDLIKNYTLPILGTIPDFNINNNPKKTKRKKK